MRVGIIQSNYIPWRGYFDFIDDADLFLFHDDLQYTKGDWRNRNKIKTPAGPQWLTVPVKYHDVHQRIDETAIDRSQPWERKHLNLLREHYRTAPAFAPVFEEFSAILARPHDTISQLNIALITWVMGRLGITTPVRMTSEFHPQGAKTERLIGLLKAVGADAYLSGPAASDYLDLHLFEENGIALEYKSYQYPEYRQCSTPFDGAVTVLDLLFQFGTVPKELFKSQQPNQIIVPPAAVPV